MNSEERKRASVDLTLTYFGTYYSNWRLTKVLTNKKLLDDKYEFFSDIAVETRQFDDTTGEATIAQEIQYGLYFDSISQCVQYVEDLFALIQAARKPDFFIRNIVTYQAGTITSAIKWFKPSAKTVADAFHYPYDLQFEDQEHRAGYDLGVANLIALVEDLIKFYKDYSFFYNQYKHGLAIAMRPLGNMWNKELIDKDKEEPKNPHFLVVYDNLNIKAASTKGTFRVRDGVFMPGFSDNVRPHIGKLEKENNFLRFVFPADLPDFKYDILIDTARKASMCINTFIANYSREIKPDEGGRKFQLPADYKRNTTYVCSM